MDKLALSFFPFPYVHKNERHSGFATDWPERCTSCDRQCERNRSREIELCSYGVNYVCVDDDVLVAGVIIKDFPRMSPARRKMLRRVYYQPTLHDIRRAIAAYRGIAQAEAEDIRKRKDAIIEQYKASKGYREELLEILRPEFKRMLAQIHDYRQFVSQVVQNVNVILERRAPGCPMDEKLARAEHEEAAIYWAARLMEEKILTALFLLDPDRIDAPAAEVIFSLHGCVLKYVRIYQKSFEQKDIKIRVIGTSHGRVRANPAAVSVIPHTLIDNALKYSPRGSQVDVTFGETDTAIRFSVGAFGPRIDPDEREAIFDLFYRGREAKRLEPDGTGFGLHLSALVASKLKSQIEVEQGRTSGSHGLHWTEFSFTLPRTA